MSNILHNCDMIIHVICHHPDHSSRYYTFGVDSSREASEIRDAVEKEVNRYGFWHDIYIWAEVWINNELHRIDY